PIDEMWVGHRPGSRDDAPILGPGPAAGLVYATGHHRNGILLAPITADTIAQFVIDGTLHPAIRPFGVERFAPAPAAEWPMTKPASIRVNGEIEPLAVASLAALLAEKALDVSQRGIAVALNGAVVPRAAWGATALKAGDSVEIVRARQGG